MTKITMPHINFNNNYVIEIIIYNNMKFCNRLIKYITTTLIILSVLIIGQSFKYSTVGLANKSPKEDIISWNKWKKLKQSDFKATNKSVNGFAVATTASAFGFQITDRNGEISGSIYVQFYCDSSWWNPDYKYDDNRHEILVHEQLHFDICELYGRKLYKEILLLKNKGRLNDKSVSRLSTKLDLEYSRYQDEYDRETNHSINTKAQEKWNKKVSRELKLLSDYADYSSF